MFRRSAIGGLHRSTALVAPQSRLGREAGGLATSKPSGVYGLAVSKPSDIDGLAASKPSGEDGFTLLEIVVVLALIALVSALLIGGSGALLRAVGREDVENTALSAMASARHGAVLAGRTLELRVDDKTRVLDWGVGRVTLAGEDTVRLLPPLKISSLLIGGRLQEEPVARVRFYADGTCDPFRLEIVRGPTSHLLLIDPWTCTVLAPGAKERSR